MNEFLFFATLLFSFVAVIFCFRFWGKTGLFAWVAFATVLANIEVIKCVDLFGLPVTLGNVLYGSTFLCTDILSENYSSKISRSAVRLGFFALLVFVGLSQMSLGFVPNAEDFASPSLEVIFAVIPRICIASLLCFLFSNTLDTYLYAWISKKTTKLWIRNNGSTLISQLVDSILFTYGAFWGLFSESSLWKLVVTTYAIKIIVAILDTPFAYWAKHIYKKCYEK